MGALDGLGAANLRDLGGLVGLDGRRIRPGLLFRSEFPAYLDADGKGAALLGVVTVVDLRRAEEIAWESHPWSEWGVAHYPVALSAGGLDSWQAGYHGYLEHGPDAVVAAVAEIVRPGAVPALIFCAAGKDRTGVVAALVLHVLGVERADILRDHLRSAAGIDRIVVRLAATPPYLKQLAGKTPRDVAPDPALVERLLDWVDARGGAWAWLVENGVPAEHLTTFAAAVLEPSAP